jgi:peptide-methionine (S)-S-oxide reductase
MNGLQSSTRRIIGVVTGGIAVAFLMGGGCQSGSDGPASASPKQTAARGQTTAQGPTATADKTDNQPGSQQQPGILVRPGTMKTEQATFAAGCFWGVEFEFAKIPGVVKTSVGYTGGKTANPTYEQVCAHGTGHAEAVLVEFDPQQVTYDALLDNFWAIHDPTQLDRQGPDIGDQYRSAIFYHSPAQEKAARASLERHQASGREKRQIVTRIVPAATFYPAEDYHQKYFERRGQKSCHIRRW